MTDSPRMLNDQRLADALTELARQTDTAALMADVARAIETLPQKRRRGWLHGPWSRTLSMSASIALLLIGIGLLGAIAVGTGLVSLPSDPLPRPAPPVPQPTLSQTSPTPAETEPANQTSPPSPLPAAMGELAVNDGACGVIAIDPRTGDQQRVSEGFPNCYAPSNTTDLSWSPDGKILAIGFTFFCGGCGSNAAQAAIENEVDGIWLLNAATGEFQQLEKCPVNCNVEHLRWSPDGSQLAFVLSGDVLVADVASPESAHAVEGVAAQPVTDLSWSPDGQHLAIAAGGRIAIAAAGPSDAPDGLSDSTSWGMDQEIVGVDWAPDGDSLLITRPRSVAAVELTRQGQLPADPVVHVLNEVSEGEIAFGRWSVDGSRVAFTRASEPTFDDDISQEIWQRVEYWTMAANGDDAQRVYASQWDVVARSAPAWSPDSGSIAFTLVRLPPYHEAHTLIVPLRNEGPIIIRHGPPSGNYVGHPAWRRDGTP